jgi:hypothetical protein
VSSVVPFTASFSISASSTVLPPPFGRGLVGTNALPPPPYDARRPGPRQSHHRWWTSTQRYAQPFSSLPVVSVCNQKQNWGHWILLLTSLASACIFLVQITQCILLLNAYYYYSMSRYKLTVVTTLLWCNSAWFQMNDSYFDIYLLLLLTTTYCYFTTT